MGAPALVIGAGGLGCPALLGLVAGGARHLVLVDHDRVDLSNLPRQVLYDSGALGVTKTAAASWSRPAPLRSSSNASPADAQPPSPIATFIEVQMFEH